MSIMPRQMSDEIEVLQHRIDQFLRDMPFRAEIADGAAIPVDIQETEDAVIIKAMTPGIKPEDLIVEIRGSVLKIQGESRDEAEDEGATWFRRERHMGHVSRIITLPAPISSTNSTAKMHDGMVEIRLPKAEPVDAHRISVTTT